MNVKPLVIDCLVNKSFYVKSMLDTGCLCFSVFDESLVRANNFHNVEITPRPLRLADGKVGAEITHMARVNIDIDGRQEIIWGYVMPRLAYPIILGKPWMEKTDVVYLAKRHCLRIGSRRKGIMVRESGWYENRSPPSIKSRVAHVNCNNTALTSGADFAKILKDAKPTSENWLGAISIHDITRALEKKKVVGKKEVQASLP